MKKLNEFLKDYTVPSPSKHKTSILPGHLAELLLQVPSKPIKSHIKIRTCGSLLPQVRVFMPFS